jgi:hypothetical protein
VSSYEDDISIKIVLHCLIGSGGVRLYAGQKGVLMEELSHKMEGVNCIHYLATTAGSCCR